MCVDGYGGMLQYTIPYSCMRACYWAWTRCRILQPQKRAVPVGDGAGYVLCYSAACRSSTLYCTGVVAVVGGRLRYDTRLADWLTGPQRVTSRRAGGVSQSRAVGLEASGCGTGVAEGGGRREGWMAIRLGAIQQ